MGKAVKFVIAALLVVLVSGCVHIKGTSNTSLIRPIPPGPTFQLVNMTDGDPAVARKIGRMVAYQMLKQGFRNPDGAAPDFKVLFSFDVSSAGSTSVAFTTVNQPANKYVVNGNVVTKKASYANATTVVNTDPIFQKTITVRIVNAKTGEPHWEGQVSEVGWCNQIFVTAPAILSLMFEKFPQEATNVTKVVSENEPSVQELRKLFPEDTNWSCR